MFDAFDDDFAVDQGFLCDSLLRNANHTVSKQSPCKSTTLDSKTTKIPASETSTESRLKRFCFVKTVPTNLSDGTENPKIRKISEAKIPESQNLNNADLSVLQNFDFDSFDNDDFDFDDSNVGDSIPISPPSSANHTSRAADLLCGDLSIQLPIKYDSRTSVPSSGTCESKDPKCHTLSVTAISNDSKLAENSKNATERTNIAVVSHGSNITANPIVQCKRKFPGPAGLLPKFSRQPESNQFSRTEVGLFNNDNQKKDSETITESQLPSNMEMSCSQIFEDPFQKAPWVALEKDLLKNDAEQHLQILHKFNISMVLKMANNQKALTNLKFPVLCVVIHSMVKADQPDVSAVFKDKTGSISGMISQKLIQEFTEHFKPGSVLVLKQIMVMKLSSRNHCLNITPSSVVAIYSEVNSGIVEHLELNPVSWSTLLQDANAVPPKALLNRTSSSSRSVLSHKATPPSSPLVFQSRSDQVLKSVQSHDQMYKTPSIIQTHVHHKPAGVNSSPIATTGSNTYTNSVNQRNSPRNILGDLERNNVQSTPKEPLQNPIYKSNTGCDLADDQLWTDDDFESMLMDSDMASAI